MSSATLPQTPVENWEQVRDEWVAEVERFMDEAEGWAKKKGWGTLQELKTIDETDLGSYEVPQLLIHDTFGRLLLTPEARFVMGADGLMFFIVIPSWDDHMIARIGVSGFISMTMPTGRNRRGVNRPSSRRHFSSPNANEEIGQTGDS